MMIGISASLHLQKFTAKHPKTTSCNTSVEKSVEVVQKFTAKYRKTKSCNTSVEKSAVVYNDGDMMTKRLPGLA